MWAPRGRTRRQPPGGRSGPAGSPPDSAGLSSSARRSGLAGAAQRPLLVLGEKINTGETLAPDAMSPKERDCHPRPCTEGQDWGPRSWARAAPLVPTTGWVGTGPGPGLEPQSSVSRSKGAESRKPWEGEGSRPPAWRAGPTGPTEGTRGPGSPVSSSPTGWAASAWNGSPPSNKRSVRKRPPRPGPPLDGAGRAPRPGESPPPARGHAASAKPPFGLQHAHRGRGGRREA